MSEITPPKYIDDITVRETYAETVQVVIDSGGLVRIELCVDRWPPEAMSPPNSRVPVARIALPVGLAGILRDQLGLMLERIQKVREGSILPESPAKN